MEYRCDKTCPALAARAIEVRKAAVNIGVTAIGQIKVIKCQNRQRPFERVKIAQCVSYTKYLNRNTVNPCPIYAMHIIHNAYLLDYADRRTRIY